MKGRTGLASVLVVVLLVLGFAIRSTFFPVAKAVVGVLTLAVNLLLPVAAAAVIGWVAYNFIPRRRLRAYWRWHRRNRSHMHRRLKEAAAADVQSRAQ